MFSGFKGTTDCNSRTEQYRATAYIALEQQSVQ